MPYRNVRTGEMIETTWDRHPPDGDKARIWKREDRPTSTDIALGHDDGTGNWRYPWFYVLPRFGNTNVRHSSIARTWEAAMYQVRMAYMDHWMTTHGLGDR